LWHHYCLVWDDDNDKGYIFVDGELVLSYSGGIARTAGSVSMEIGKDDSFARYFDGYVDECKLFSRHLSQQEIISAMNNTDPRHLAYGTISSAKPPHLVYDPDMGACLEFFSGGTYGPNELNVGDAFKPERFDVFEISFWFKTSTTGVWQMIISNLDPATDHRGLEVNLHPSGFMYLSVLHEGGVDELGIRTETSGWNDGVWHYFRGTYDGQSNNYSTNIYLDGVRQPVWRGAYTLTDTIVSSIDTKIGSRSGSYYFNGRLKDLRFWKK